MTIHHLCPRCGVKHTTPGMCKECRTQDNRRRTELNIQHGRNTKQYRQIRKVVLARDGYRCTHCGGYYDLQAHFVPRGQHTGRPSDYITLCSSCHGHESQSYQ